ncbi:MAG: ABC transporter substrate-binding protein [Clostridia bacterium]|nr:ABC transporter substrate-binding protein [Clostridia bacterium]
MKNVFEKILIVLLAVFVLSASACSEIQYVADDISEPEQTESAGSEEKIPEESSPVSGGRLMLTSGAYSSLNPLTTDNEDIKQYMNLVYGSIVSLDYDMSPKAELAESWSCDEECRVWTFNFRSGITWHDGSSFDAKDAAATIEYIKSVGGNYSENVANIDKCTAQSESVLVVECKEPDGMLTCKMAIPVIKSESLKSSTANTLPIGTGMYKYNTYESMASKICLERNDMYYGNIPYIESVEINVYADEEQRSSGEFDFSMLYDTAFSSEFAKEGSKSANFSGSIFMCLLPNISKKSVMNDANIRHAVSCFSDRSNIINAAAAGNAESALLPAYKGTFCWQDDGVIDSADAASGETYMKNAGYTKSDSGLWNIGGKNLELTCIVPADFVEHELLALKLKDELEKQGISVNNVILDEKLYADALKSGSYDLAIMEIKLGSWIDLESVFSKDGELNINVYSNEQLETLFDNVAATSDSAAVSDMYRQIKEILLEDMPIIGLYIKNSTVVSSFRLWNVATSGIYTWDIFANID